jgi:aryl-alcohol dehydrogenase-like predicted oxidoreductase
VDLKQPILESRRILGRTGLAVAPLGFGTFKIGRNQGIKYPVRYRLPSKRSVDKLLSGVLDLGINYIDTAPAYGLSEERIGEAIGRRRKEFVLSTKAGELFRDGASRYDFSRAATVASVEGSLRRLHTEAIDIVFVHANGGDLDIIENTDVVETLNDLRGQGKLRWIGLSGKTVQGFNASLKWADVIMAEFSHSNTELASVLEKAHRGGIGVVVKKGLESGWLDHTAGIEFVLLQPFVDVMLIGSLNLAHMRQNATIAAKARPLRSRAGQVVAELGPGKPRGIRCLAESA